MEEKVAELVIITEGWATRDFKKLSDLDGVIAGLSHGATSLCILCINLYGFKMCHDF